MFVATPVRSGVLLRLCPRFATRLELAPKPRTGEKIGPARSSRGVGTIQRVFCFHGDCGPVLAAGWVLRIRFSIKVESRDGRRLKQRARRRPRGEDDLSFENESGRRRKPDP